jgi:hypothetical protein
MARTWARWDRGDLATRDDRVFAPYPDSWALGEGFLLQSLVGYPFARVLGSAALGFNVPYFLACAATLVATGMFFARIAGPGIPALLGAILFTWGPARLNNVGVLTILWAGLLPLCLFFGLRFLDRGRLREAVLLAVSWVVLGLGSLYGLLMGSIFATLFLLGAALPDATRRRRIPALLAAQAAAAAILVFPFLPYLRLAEDFGARVGAGAMEGQSADILSLLHAGVFSGVTGAALERLFPFFPNGTSALFPMLTFLLAAALAWRVRGRARRPERQAFLWVLLAAVTFLFALGPTVHVAGRRLFPGPWRLVATLPVFDSVRGLFRWDQWFDFALCAATAILLAAVARRATPRRRAAVLCAAAFLVTLDIWPRKVPHAILPEPSPFTDVYRSLPRDAIVAVYPFDRDTSERAWIEQLAHGRRVVNGFQTFPPPITYWAFSRLKTASAREVLAIYRELGAWAVEARLSDLPPERARDLVEAVRVPGAAREILFREGRLLALLEPREPVLVDPARLADVSFNGGTAELARVPGRLVFRLGAPTRDVLVLGAAGTRRGVLTIPTAGAASLHAKLDIAVFAGDEVLDAKTRRRIGSVVGAGSARR